jgi:DUF971 family protein
MAAVAHVDNSPDAPPGETMPPTEIRVLQQGRILQFVWTDRGPTRLTAATLRSRCRCAECTSIRRRGGVVATDPNVAIVDAQPIGAGALNLHFSDDHRRGIFPFAWLASLNDEAMPDGIAP